MALTNWERELSRYKLGLVHPCINIPRAHKERCQESTADLKPRAESEDDPDADWSFHTDPESIRISNYKIDLIQPYVNNNNNNKYINQS